jgi:hypothetical protein
MGQTSVFTENIEVCDEIALPRNDFIVVTDVAQKISYHLFS